MSFEQPLTELASGQMENNWLQDDLDTEPVNQKLDAALSQNFLSPESAIQVIRKVLHFHGLDMPALYGADPEGDEIVFEIGKFGQPDLTTNIYILYYLTDDGHYEFFAEIGDEARMDELMSDSEEEDNE
mgnify:FL=1|jgi:hypothetical protein